VSDFATFVLEQLPPPPARVLEVGCGEEGGLVATLAGAGYDVLGVDPHAPDAPGFLRARFQHR
jgi:2-polyprenyl-3-methyl-5-hydroxy-6-metoxy-1,4-benzoquinol methylase